MRNRIGVDKIGECRIVMPPGGHMAPRVGQAFFHADVAEEVVEPASAIIVVDVQCCVIHAAALR